MKLKRNVLGLGLEKEEETLKHGCILKLILRMRLKFYEVDEEIKKQNEQIVKKVEVWHT